MEGVFTRAEAAEWFELPADRIGDLVVISERFTVIGTSAARHDLCAGSAAAQPRRHQRAARAADPEPRHPRLDRQRRWRNFDAFDLALNHV
jgi:phosphonoacetate hydrolase